MIFNTIQNYIIKLLLLLYYMCTIIIVSLLRPLFKKIVLFQYLCPFSEQPKPYMNTWGSRDPVPAKLSITVEVTHTEGPGQVRSLCRPFCPPDARSLLASRGKMAWELRRLIQFTITVCTDDSSAWWEKTTLVKNEHTPPGGHVSKTTQVNQFLCFWAGH